MNSEAGLWSTLNRKCGTLLCLKRIENSCDRGTPDVAWSGKLPDGKCNNVRVYRRANGMLELKEAEWPAKPQTPLNIEKLFKEQVLWAEDWERAGGRVAALLQVDRDYLVVPPSVLRLIFERKVTRHALQPYVIGTGTFPVAVFIKRLFE